jgi:hypothetical protein
LKALYFAVAFVVSIGPASANGLALSGRNVHVAQTEPSRLYRAQVLSTLARSEEAELPISVSTAVTTSGEQEEPGAADAATAEISASLKAKIRAIVAFARQEVRNAPDGSKVVASRIRVRCAVKQIVEEDKASLAAAPALLLSQPAAAEPARVSSTLEACSIKLVQVRRNGGTDTGKRNYEVTLPPVEDATP